VTAHAAERELHLRSGATRVRVSGAGVPFVWTHGFTSSMAAEDAIGSSALLADLPGVQLVRYDARGHGSSAAGRDDAATTWPSLALDLLELCDALALARPIAGGASMGVATALHAALRGPARFSALVLFMPPTAWETRKAQADVYRAGADLVEAHGVERYVAAVRASLRLRPMPGLGEPAEQAMLDALRAKTAPELARLLRGAAASDLPSPDAIAKLALPTLILPVDGDPGHPLSTAERLHERIAASELHVLRDLSALAEARAVVSRFLARLR
jgi:pimeloyl-ACP methyl ester carboxylesterase